MNWRAANVGWPIQSRRIHHRDGPRGAAVARALHFVCFSSVQLVLLVLLLLQLKL